MQAANSRDDISKTILAVIVTQYLPVRPVAILQNPPGEPGGVSLKINFFGAHVPEEMG